MPKSETTKHGTPTRKGTPGGAKKKVPRKRALMDLSTAELRSMAEDGLDAFAQAMQELASRKKRPGTRLFHALMSRRPAPGQIDSARKARRHSVYVIELRKEVLEKGAFRKKNPNYVDGQPCVYVGMTGHTPEARLEKHLSGTSAGRFVADHGLELLPRLYEDRNPLTYREAVIEERALALELRDRGFGVWQN